MSEERCEFHVAQQSRREKLRVVNSEEIDIVHNPYDPSVVLSSSEMINFTTTTSTDSGGGLQHLGCGWSNISDYNSTGSVLLENSNNLSRMFVAGGGGGALSESLNLNDNNMDVKPSFFGTEMQCVLYHDTLQGVVTSAGNQGVERRGVGSLWSNENESGFLMTPKYMDQSRHCEMGSNSRTNVVSDNSSAQGLALSLSPVPQSRTNTMQVEKRNNAVVPENFPHRNAVPLGPFTGYATILKSSKFLRPAQQLLDELCDLAAGSSNVIKCSNFSKKIRDGFRVSCDVNVAAESSSGGCGGGGDSGGLNESNVRPDYLQKKAKLMIMQDEICKRYRQYHQQMQMVVSSFEAVAGLSAATPYISLALKTVTQHFKSLRNAITDHLKHIRQALGEDLPSPASGMSNKGYGNSSRLRSVDQTTLDNQKSGGGAGVAFFESQHVWRPQRGLPERAVAILRAWLFDHFLHPYPTDSDKHMLASQTGLTRNQVSNWFINARVRVWKPMVEEIHMLETKGGDQTGSSISKSDGNKLVAERTNQVSCSQHLNTVLLNMSGVVMPEKEGIVGPSERLDDSSSSDHTWRNQEKRSRIECHSIPTASSIDGSLMGFVPYQRNALEIGGNIGPVSLTLGLRQNVEAAQQQQLQMHQHRLRQQFGGQIIHDFVD